jgi:EpsI family protein
MGISMKINSVQDVLAAVAILASTVLAEAIRPRELMARTTPVPDLEKVIPRDFGEWHLVPNVGLVTPSEPFEIESRELASRIYSQEVSRGYADRNGNMVMFLIAYGPVQNYRLKSHLPDVCYRVAGFRMSPKTVVDVSYSDDAYPIRLSRLVAEKEGRFEPISYWLRVGNDIVTGVFDSQLVRMKYGLHGLIPDGALIRVSTVGLAKDVSYKLQDRFIRDFIAAIAPENRKFFVGS